MDVCSIYACPVGALLAAVFFFWIYGKEDCLAQVNLARQKPLAAGSILWPSTAFAA